MLASGIHLLACFKPEGQVVLFRRDGTGSVLREHARPVVRFVEIQDHLAVRIWHLCVELPAQSVRLLAVSGVLEHDEELTLSPSFDDCIKSIGLPVKFKSKSTRT